MKTVSPDVPPTRIVLFGLRCRFTEVVAQTLVTNGQPPAVQVFPGPDAIIQPLLAPTIPRSLPMATPAQAGRESAVPTYQIGKVRSPETVALIDALDPDLIVVACFPRLIPKEIRERATLGSVNIHPSLLPAHRGPDPLFWIMREGGNGCGVTVHELSDEFDRGNILAQRSVPYPNGARERDLEALLARTGAEALLDILPAIRAGRQPRRRQDERLASYESWPAADDFCIGTDRPARDAWNFIRGIAERGVPVRLETGAGVIAASDAIAYGEFGAPPPATDGQQVVRFNPGWLLVTTDREARD